MPNTDATKARLEAQLAELEQREKRIAQDLAEPLNADSSEQAVEMQDDVSLEGQAALVAREIASVNRALLRVETGIVVAPVYISPLFNTYKSLPQTPLKAQILSMARANQIPATDVYWFDASRQSKRVSANVSGMFNTTRISLNDNLLNRTSEPEILAVMGHEMGHYVLNHVYKGVMFFTIVIVLLFAFIRWSFGWVMKRWGDANDITVPYTRFVHERLVKADPMAHVRIFFKDMAHLLGIASPA